MDNPCTHLHGSRSGPPIGRLTAVFVLTAVFMVVEAVGGWLSGSLALLADAGHMLTDVERSASAYRLVACRP
jgi:cobalt-zinc-cadmium efflux system protein